MNNKIMLDATKDEADWVRHAARLRGLSMSEYIKRAINAALRRDGVDAVMFAEHPPLYADEHGDWAAANSGIGERLQTLERAIGNCYMMAKRQIAAHLNGTSTTEKDLERWQHVQRFCETTGSKSSILRGQLPTEMTEGTKAG